MTNLPRRTFQFRIIHLIALVVVCAIAFGAWRLYTKLQATTGISTIEHFSPKGRVQDRAYNPNQPAIDSLIEKGKKCIPLLIEMLDDDSAIDHQIIDYWPTNTVGDIAFVILTHFTTDSSWKVSTIPRASWDEVLGSNPNNMLPAFIQLARFKREHGSNEIKRRWEKIWSEHREQIYWDPKERCFKLKATKGASNHSVERTGASRSTRLQLVCQRRLAPAAHAEP